MTRSIPMLLALTACVEGTAPSHVERVRQARAQSAGRPVLALTALDDPRGGWWQLHRSVGGALVLTTTNRDGFGIAEQELTSDVTVGGVDLEMLPGLGRDVAQRSVLVVPQEAP